MNCAVHTETTATAYCRTCGKPMCPACARNVRGVVYCEDCIASKLGDTIPAGAAPAAAYSPGAAVPVVVTSGPSPGLAGVLAGLFPFGVGQVYTGQYAKGLAHLLIFSALVWGASSTNGAEPFFGIGIAGFYIYQIIDAVRSAKAIQVGEAPPDPFGLAKTFTTGEKPDLQRVPVGSLVLIGLGVLFLFDTLGLFEFHRIGRLWPLVLIVVGVWMFMKRMNPAAPPDGDVHGGGGQ